ncbi:hypothetical protein B0T10DRAFT_456432 [Thelonectria olida]|uniref:Secreted protein n=1 Tax=Thelonectria olida TaxID=1576542 RepID=A0A9P8WCI8_9HYPO|nr:hypothetical protein B0T10DRAFT_456432 [Thelonectria olida]
MGWPVAVVLRVLPFSFVQATSIPSNWMATMARMLPGAPAPRSVGLLSPLAPPYISFWGKGHHSGSTTVKAQSSSSSSDSSSSHHLRVNDFGGNQKCSDSHGKLTSLSSHKSNNIEFL